jgi:hypothetical protein
MTWLAARPHTRLPWAASTMSDRQSEEFFWGYRLLIPAASRGAAMAQTESTIEAPFAWGESLEQASDRAESEGKLVLLDFYSPT